MADEQPGTGGWGRYAAYTQLGTEMVAPIVVGLLIDYAIDTLPWLTIAGAVVGLLGCFYHLYRLETRNQPPKK